MRELDDIRVDLRNRRVTHDCCLIRLLADIPDLLDALAAEKENANDLEGCLSAGQMVLCEQNATIENLRIDITKDAEIEQVAEYAEMLIDTLAEKDAEIERLRELSGRLEEAEYGMVAGNGVHDPITWECANEWFKYVRTGKEMTDERT